MHCPVCQNSETKVIDSRTAAENSIRRRRECEKCGFRFSTYEQMEISDLDVLKKDGKREPYSREKLENGIRKALQKRPVSRQNYNQFLLQVEQSIMRRASRPQDDDEQTPGAISSREIGEIIMTGLKDLDQVAYIRFASVYRSFQDIESFKEQISELESVQSEPRL